MSTTIVPLCDRMPVKEMRVGLSISLTGRYAWQGRQAFEAIRLWASQEPNTRLIYYDDASRTAQAQQNTLKLLRDDKVDLLLGPYSSDLTLVVAPIAEEYKKVLWNYGGASDEICNHGLRYIVCGCSPASDYFRALPAWLAEHAPGLRDLSILYSTKGTFASHVARGLSEAAAASHSVELLPVDTPVSSLQSGILVLAGTFQQEIGILRERSNFPATIPRIAAVAAGVDEFYEHLGEHADAVIGPSQWEPDADSDWFIRQYESQAGRAPNYISAGAFAMCIVMSECVRRAGSPDNTRLRQIASELELDTLYGNFRIDPETGRQLGHRITLVEWRHGRKIRLSETDRAPVNE